MTTDDEPVRVLHVDDRELSRELVAERLEGESDRIGVTGVEDAATALERLDAEPGFDCVLSDYLMPGTDGLELLERVRERHPRLPFFLYTVGGDPSIAEAAVDAGATDYVGKSFGRGHYAVLAHRLVRAVEHRRAERDRRRQRAALAATREGACLLDADRRIEWVDETFRDRYGYAEGELVGASWERLHPEREVEHLATEAFPEATATGEWSGRTVGRRADGTTVPEWRTVTTLPGGGLALLSEHDDLAGRPDRTRDCETAGGGSAGDGSVAHESAGGESAEESAGGGSAEESTGDGSAGRGGHSRSVGTERLGE